MYGVYFSEGRNILLGSCSSYTHCNILVLCGRKETLYPKAHTTKPNLSSRKYHQTEFQVNAILSESLKFTKLQEFKFDLEFKMAGDEDEDGVDQEILNAAGKVIPNIILN